MKVSPTTRSSPFRSKTPPSPTTDIGDIPKHTYVEIKRFFEDYKVLEEKSVVVDEIRGATEGIEAVKQGLAYYRQEENRLRGWG